MIPIKAFILSLCAVIILVITGFFYLEANRVLGRRFEEIDAIHSKSVVEYARTVLEGRRYLLTAFRSQIDPDNHLAKSFLVASGKKDFAHVKKAIEVIRKRTKCDVVDIIDIGDGSSVGIPDLKHALSGRRIVHNGESIIIVTQIQGHLAILSLSPLMLFQYPVGVAALGYYLDGELTREISNATNTRVSFASPDLADTHGTRIKIGDGAGEVSLVANSHVMTSITHELRGDVLTIAASSLLLVILLIYSILNFGFLRSFREILSSIEGSAEDLAKNKITERKAKRYPIREVAILSSVFARFTKSLFEFQRRIQQKSQAEAAGKVLSLVVHDTNKAVGAMFMELDLDKEEISEHKRRSIHNLATRIQGISGSVLAKFEKDSLEAGGEVSVEKFVLPTEPPSVEMLSLLVDSIAAEKSMFYWNKSQAQIEVEIDPESFKVFVEVQPEAFNRALGSIVDNAVQSISGPGRVTLSIHADEERACIRVTDTGCGIAKEKFSELGEWGNSFGKPEGVGVGFWYVKQIVAFWKGDLDIKSDPGRGTSIEMQLPRSKRESVLLPELSIEEGSLLITLDDEDSMRAQWEARLNGLEISDRVERRHFHKAHELLVWWRTQGRDLGKTPLFLCDYQLGSQDWNGLQVIEEMGIGANSILVTGYFDKKEVREGCSHLGIRLLPKTIVPFLPILIKHRGKKVGGVTAGGAA